MNTLLSEQAFIIYLQDECPESLQIVSDLFAGNSISQTIMNPNLEAIKHFSKYIATKEANKYFFVY